MTPVRAERRVPRASARNTHGSPPVAGNTRTLPASGQDPATRRPSGLTDGPQAAPSDADGEVADLACRGDVPHPDRAFVARGDHPPAVRAEHHVVEVDLVAAELLDRPARHRVPDVDDAGLLGALGDEEPAVRAPVHGPANVGERSQDPVGGDPAVQGLQRLGQHRLVVPSGRVHRRQGEQDAELGVVAGCWRRRRQPARGPPRCAVRGPRSGSGRSR